MSSLLRLWVGIIFFLVISGQNGSTEDKGDENGMLDSIRQKIQATTRENNELTAQNKALKAQFIGLELEIEQVEKTVRSLDPEYTAGPKYEREQSQAYSQERAGSGRFEEDPLVREAQELYASGQWLNLDEGQKLRELYLYDLQYEKQELQLDLMDLEAMYGQAEGERRRQLDALEKEIRENKEKEKELSFRIIELEKAAMTYPQKINLLEVENDALKKKIAEMRRSLSR